MKDIIILGMGPSRAACPFDAEVWGVNNGYRQVAKLGGKLDKLFICHRGQELDYVGDEIFDFDELNELADLGVEIMTLFDVKEIKKKTRFSFRKLATRFNTRYFTDSLAYMVAYALYLNTSKYKGKLKLKEPMRIRLYGCDMHSQDEYNTERGGIEYFIAIAKTIGVDVWVHPDSALCKTENGHPYGFFKFNYKKLDPHNIMELQKTPDGVRELWRKDIITAKQMEEMIAELEKLETKTSV